MRPSRFNDGTTLIVPAVLLLALVFVVPLIWFFVRTLAGIGTFPEILSHVWSVVTSKAVITAMRTTNWISLIVTLLVLLISYPVAYYLANNRGWRFTLVLFCIIVPYFTSIIVRTYSWMVLLGRNGLVNQVLMQLGLIHQPLTMLYTEVGVLIGMVYVPVSYTHLRAHETVLDLVCR